MVGWPERVLTNILTTFATTTSSKKRRKVVILHNRNMNAQALTSQKDHPGPPLSPAGYVWSERLILSGSSNPSDVPIDCPDLLAVGKPRALLRTSTCHLTTLFEIP